jgi:hypothetical protein
MTIYQNEKVLMREVGLLRVGVFTHAKVTEMEGTEKELKAHARKLAKEPNTLYVNGSYK